jgi:hypothetical protein
MGKGCYKGHSSCCALAIVFDVVRGNPRKMWIMNVVWPITALWSGPLGFWFYWRAGRAFGREVGFLTAYPVNWWLALV